MKFLGNKKVHIYYILSVEVKLKHQQYIKLNRYQILLLMSSKTKYLTIISYHRGIKFFNELLVS
jgi:hypothetical protein